MNDLTDKDLLDEQSAIAGLTFINRQSVIHKIPTDRYAFVKQETDVRVADDVCQRGEKIGEIVVVDYVCLNNRHQENQEDF